MKTFLLLLLLAICSLTNSARPNLRLLRSIPNRKPRDPLSIAKPSDQEYNRVIDRGFRPPPPITVAPPDIIDGVQVLVIFRFFAETENQEYYEELMNLLQSDCQSAAIQYCVNLNTIFTEALCEYYIRFLN